MLKQQQTAFYWNLELYRLKYYVNYLLFLRSTKRDFKVNMNGSPQPILAYFRILEKLKDGT